MRSWSGCFWEEPKIKPLPLKIREDQSGIETKSFFAAKKGRSRERIKYFFTKAKKESSTDLWNETEVVVSMWVWIWTKWPKKIWKRKKRGWQGRRRSRQQQQLTDDDDDRGTNEKGRKRDVGCRKEGGIHGHRRQRDAAVSNTGLGREGGGWMFEGGK